MVGHYIQEARSRDISHMVACGRQPNGEDSYHRIEAALIGSGRVNTESQ